MDDELDLDWLESDSIDEAYRSADKEFGQERLDELERLRAASEEAREAALRADEAKYRAYIDADDAYHEAWKVLDEIQDRLLAEARKADDKAFEAEMEKERAKHKADRIEFEQWMAEYLATRQEWVQ